MNRISRRVRPVSDAVSQKLAEFATVIPGFSIKTTSGIREATLNGPKRETATPATKWWPVHFRSNSGQVKVIEKEDIESIVGGVYPVVGERLQKPRCQFCPNLVYELKRTPRFIGTEARTYGLRAGVRVMFQERDSLAQRSSQKSN